MADITNAVDEWKSPWHLVLALSREPLDVDQICQLQRMCASLRGTIY